MSQSPNVKHLNKIESLIQRRQLDEALDKAMQLLESYPKSMEVPAKLGKVLVMLKRYDEALSYLEQALQKGAKSHDVLLDIGVCYFVLQQYQEALAPLLRAVQLAPERPAARNNLANTYLALGEVETAYRNYAENIRRDPLNVAANYGFSQFVTYTADDKVFSCLPPLMSNSDIPAIDRAMICYTLGKAYWDIGDTEQSFESYKLANELMRKIRGSELPERGQLESIQRLFQPDVFISQQAGGMDEIPTLFIAGMSRSGKSLVESLLNGVEGVNCEGETQRFRHYFNHIIQRHGGAGHYLEQLTPERCLADAQGYLDVVSYDGTLRTTTRPMDIWALGLVGLWFPKSPIVFCRRRLEDLGLSAYCNFYAEGNQHTNDLYELGEHIAYYEQAMQHWARVLPNPIYWVDYEELVQTPEAVANRLLKAIGKTASNDLTQQAQKNASFAKHLSLARSLDVPMPLRNDFVGVAKPFDHHLAPLRQGYREAMEANGLPAQVTEGFDWQLTGRLVVIDNAARLPREENFVELMASNTFGVVAFDPASRIKAEQVQDLEEFQYVPHALLGDGRQAILYATLDESLSSVLPPLPVERLPNALHSGAQILTKLPITTLRLDDIEGLASLDWLILDELSDAMAVLENGTRTLKDTLLLQVRLAFQPTHEKQPNFTEVSHWASRHGFAFYRLNNPSHRSLLPEREDIVRPQATQLATADAIFIPAPERLASLAGGQRQRLAFLLDTVFGIHDLPHQLLAEQNEEQAERYLRARGYVGTYLDTAVSDLPGLFTVRDPQRLAERGLAAALANHNIHGVAQLAQKLHQAAPGDKEARYYLGQALSHLGQHANALAYLTALFDEALELRFGLALAWAQRRAGQGKALKATVTKLGERHPGHLAVERLELLLLEGSHKRRELAPAIKCCDALLSHPDSAFIAAGLGDGPSARADLLGVKAALQLALAQDPDEYCQALATWRDALMALNDRQGPLRARLLMGLSEAQRQSGDPQAAVESLWQACSTYPYSLETVSAYAKLREMLAQSPDAEHCRLATLHERVQKIWRSYKGEQLQYSFGDFDLPYQGFDQLMLPGTRSAKARLAHYNLEEVLPAKATALDIGCNHGFLLLGLAEHLAQGEGFDISKACVEVGNTVAQYLGHSHITLHHKSFDEYVGNKQYDLVIACAVHQWIGKPLESFGDALFDLCKPGGIVLLESQGARSRDKTEPDFENNATAIASAGFKVLRKGSLCDDALNYREFWLMQRSAGRTRKSKPGSPLKSVGSRASIPVLEGDNKQLEPMKRICELLSKQGAWFNPDLRIRAEEGNLSLHGTPGASRASYLRVPVALMPQLEGFDIQQKNDRLVAEPNGAPLLPHQHEILESMLELYNATGKLKLWRDSVPFLAWQDTPDVLDYLVSARPLNRNLMLNYERFKAGKQDELLVESYLGARKFGLNDRHLKALGVSCNEAMVLLPVVDCLNHSLTAEGYYTPHIEGKPTMRTFHVPDAETGELFVRYNLYDAVDTTLSYGFMDSASTWLSSIPVTLSIRGQTLKVQSLPMQLRSDPIPTSFEDIRTYMPELNRQGEREATVSKLMFCKGSSYSLRRVLTYLVYQLGIAHTDLVARQQVAELERQLIEKNLQWWNGLENLTQPLPDNHAAKQLCQHSLGIIKAYQQAVEL